MLGLKCNISSWGLSKGVKKRKKLYFPQNLFSTIYKNKNKKML